MQPLEPHTAALDPNHTHFILVDDGTVCKFGGEIPLRARLERHVSTLQTTTVRGESKSLRIVSVELFCRTQLTQLVKKLESSNVENIYEALASFMLFLQVRQKFLWSALRSKEVKALWRRFKRLLSQAHRPSLLRFLSLCR